MDREGDRSPVQWRGVRGRGLACSTPHRSAPCPALRTHQPPSVWPMLSTQKSRVAAISQHSPALQRDGHTQHSLVSSSPQREPCFHLHCSVGPSSGTPHIGYSPLSTHRQALGSDSHGDLKIVMVHFPSSSIHRVATKQSPESA